MNEVPDSPNVVVQFFGGGQGFSGQTRDPLTHDVVKTLNVIGQA
jgi:hypothetical protein